MTVNKQVERLQKISFVDMFRYDEGLKEQAEEGEGKQMFARALFEYVLQ